MEFNSSTKYALFIVIVSIGISFITFPDSDRKEYCQSNNETMDAMFSTAIYCEINSTVSENFIDKFFN